MDHHMIYDTVFIVDDDRTLSFLHRRLIMKTAVGREVNVFNNPLEALAPLHGELLSPGKSILVLLDINMPEMSGFEFLEAISQFIGKIAILDILMVTSSIDHRDMEKGMGHPLVKQYITKPLKRTDILDFVRYRSLISAQRPRQCA